MRGDGDGRLREIAEASGYGDAQLELIAEATMPNRDPGATLSATQLGYLAQAAEVCRESGLRASEVADTIGRHRAQSPTEWQESFWRERLRIASERDALPGPAAPQPPPVAEPARVAVDIRAGALAARSPQPGASHSGQARTRTAIPLALDGPAQAERARPPAPIPPAAPEHGGVPPVAAIPPQPPAERDEDANAPPLAA